MTLALVVGIGLCLGGGAIVVSSVIERVAGGSFGQLVAESRLEHASAVRASIERFVDDRFTLLEDHSRHPTLVAAVMDPESRQGVTLDVLESMTMIGAVYPMALYDFEGEAICRSGWVFGTTDEALVANVLQGTLTREVSVIDLEGRGYWILLVPVRYATTIEGVLAVAVPMDRALGVAGASAEATGMAILDGSRVLASRGGHGGESATRVPLATGDVHLVVRAGSDRLAAVQASVEQRLVWSLLLLAIGASAVWLWLTNRLVVRPIRRLRDWASRVASGETLADPVIHSRFTEIESLESSFRDMASAVRDREASLSRMNQDLEARVAERTSELHRAVEAAEAASQSKSDFLANMSHEMRTPMTAILGYTELLQHEDVVGADGAEDEAEALASKSEDAIRPHAIRSIGASAEHLMTLINDLLDVSKIEAGQMTIELLDVAPQAILNEVVDLLKPRATLAGISLDLHIDSDVPRNIVSDPTRLRQVLLNVVANAVKFTEAGHVRIDVSFDPASARIAFRVEDTGIGMTAEQLAHVARFEAFTQADTSSTRRFGGTGLGLRISKSLAELLGGSIAIASEAGVGSTVTVWIAAEAPTPPRPAAMATGPEQGSPIDPKGRGTAALPTCTELLSGRIAPEPAESRVASSPTLGPRSESASNPATRLAGYRILVAEDSRDNQFLIRHQLQRAGAEVTICDDGQALVDTVERLSSDQQPDIILMDMQMPVLDGYGATARLRALGYAIPIVALTANALSGDRDRCLAAGCDAYLTKPFKPKALIETCSQYSGRVAEVPVDG